MRARAALLGLIALAGLAAPACVLIPRYRAVGPLARSGDAEETFGLDPWLLAEGVADLVVVEIDWVAGCKPGPRTVEGLREILVEHGPAGRPVELRLDDEIPRETWDGFADGQDPVEFLVSRFAGIAVEPPDADSRVERRYALFAPGPLHGTFGYSTTWSVRRGQEIRPVRGVVVSRASHARYARLWISLDRLERLTLVHEFGHQLGLVSNTAHERDRPHRHHCTSLVCPMSVPTPRVIARNLLRGLFNSFPRDYCERCRADIRRAQAVWRRRLAADPGYRAELVASRRAEERALRFRDLALKGENAQVVEEVAALRAHGEGVSALLAYEIGALADLGRLDEALARVVELPAGEGGSARWGLGRALIAQGRHAEAVGLFDREVLRRGGDYEFEQSSFVLRAALQGLGRFSEAADLIGELQARGHSISFSPEGMRRPA
jgi:hypothetical protein